MARCIIYDLDGTLLDSIKDIATALNLMRTSFKLKPLNIEEAKRCIGHGIDTLVKEALGRENVDKTEALSRMRQFYTEHLMDETTLYEGVEEGLQKLTDNGYIQAVVSNKPTEASVYILEKLGISKYFEFIIGEEKRFPLKPDPTAIKYVLEKTNSNPKESWMVGDNHTDMNAGSAAGIKLCFAKYGFGTQSEQVSPDIEVDTFKQFVDFVTKKEL